jgi:radical SAM protein with 4Fe4S-binding SPASM domain
MSASLTPLLALCHYRRRADTPRLDHYRALLDAGADPDRGVGAVRLSPLLRGLALAGAEPDADRRAPRRRRDGRGTRGGLRRVLGDRITNDDLACRARLQALVAATAGRAADDVLDVAAYTAPAVGTVERGPACANCGKTRRWDKADKPLSKCARCKAVAYCGAACQKAHWKAHKAACRAASAS